MDMYLRILKAIDEEVVDRDVIRSPQVCTVLYIHVRTRIHSFIHSFIHSVIHSFRN